MPRGRPKANRCVTAETGAPATMRERAYQHIHRLIAARVLKGGTALSELVLAKDLGVSRTPIREAIGQLVAEGLLEQTAMGTILVVQLRRQDIIELYELREALEIYAIEKAARSRITSSDRDRLERLVQDIQDLHEQLGASKRSALDAQQMERFLASDYAFHSLLISMADNSRIQKVLHEMRLLIRIFSLQRRGHERELLVKIHEQHKRVLQAVIAGDIEAARDVLSAHIRTSLQERLEEFDYWRREESLNASLPTFVTAGGQH
jgi:DNA-binding GntR family transcriptional regulator